MIEIRQLSASDFPLFQAMNTGIQNDYIVTIFPTLTEGNHHMYGLFSDKKLAVIAGFTIFQHSYAMLGRLRSDRRFRGRGLATHLINYLKRKAFEMEDIIWVGANTEEDNEAAIKLLHRTDLMQQTILYPATTADLSSLENNYGVWQETTDLWRKMHLLETTYIEKQAIFPYECYYPLPASNVLFTKEKVNAWRFFENEEKTRYFIVKKDVKKYHYLHIVYPWRDLQEQQGIWETISEVKQQEKENHYVWIDLTKDEVEQLPKQHPFTISIPWVLFGVTKAK